MESGPQPEARFALRAELPRDEPARLNALLEYDILDTLPEASYDDITQLAAEICQVPISAVSLVDAERQWFKSRVGLEAEETRRDVAFCAHALLQPDLLVVPDARKDARFADNPLVTSGPRIRFYAGAPLIAPRGEVLGTLCVIDMVPRELLEGQARSLRALSRQVMAQLELRRQMAEQDRYRSLLEQANLRLEAASQADDVSGFHNTRFLHRYLDEWVDHGKTTTRKLSLVFFDMDAFKQVVDSCGHLSGAKVLREVAHVVHGQLGPDDRIVRYGGDEFVVLLPDQTGVRALAKTERMQQAIASASFLEDEGLDIRVTASFGVATFPDDAADTKQLLLVADRGLFHSKVEGKNRVSRATGVDAE